MALKLMLQPEDKVVIPDIGMVIDVLFVGKEKVQLAFTAPKDIDINAVFKDSNLMFKNKRK